MAQTGREGGKCKTHIRLIDAYFIGFRKLTAGPPVKFAVENGEFVVNRENL
jgi:hypothetical protein